MLQLTYRERLLTWVGGSLLTLGTVYGFIVKPTLDRTQRLYELLPEKQQALEQVERMGQQYTELTQQLSGLRSTFPDATSPGSLLAHLDTLLERHALNEKATLNPELPQQEGPYTIQVIRIQLEDIPLPGLLAFLQELRTSTPRMHVEVMDLNQVVKSAHTLNANLTLTSPSRSRSST